VNNWVRAFALPLIILAAALMCGCRPAPKPDAGSGAKDAAKRYYEALLRKDWQGAHSLLTPDAKAQATVDRFARLAQEYHRSLGFEPKNVVVNACDEHGTEAVAHVTIVGTSAHHQRFKDATVLRRVGVEWLVVLNTSFGAVRRQ
jgi:hypothetical protein